MRDNTIRRMSMSDLRNEMEIAARLIEAHKRDMRAAVTTGVKQYHAGKLATLKEHAQAVSDEIICRENVFNN